MLLFVAPVLLQPLWEGSSIFGSPSYTGESESKRRCSKMYAIIETGGKQIKVEAGQEIYVEKLGVEADEVVTFDKVLFVGGENVKVGAPFVEGATVTAKAVKEGRQKKIVVFKLKAKKNYRRKQGHRQPYTKLVVESINA